MASEREEILEEIGRYKEDISDFLDDFLENWEEQGREDRWRKDIRERLQEMVKKGKMVRGSLIIIIHNLYQGNKKENAVKTGAAIELLHTGILMHDDIIDKDRHRRGIRTFQEQYRQLGEEESISEEEHFGMSMALAGGDVSFFLGQNVLSKIEASQEKKGAVHELVFREFSNVGLAEQVDIFAGYSGQELAEEDILELYRNKTARYTFSLPMKAGAILADTDEEERRKLYSIGEKMGVIFQLKDDELGLFGDREEVGEDIGSDLDEDKKTLHRLKLLERLSEDEEERIRDMLGTDLTESERREITSLMERENVRQEVRARMEELAEETFERIEELGLDEDSKNFLRKVTTYCLEREK
ncbi:MAG: polyprenyl synthetase family protein [Candidatus Nanosalina sp.]